MVRAEARTGQEPWKTVVSARTHVLLADEPAEEGGQDAGMTPFEWLAGALASCTAITLRMYAARKNWNTGVITVGVTIDQSGQGLTVFKRDILTEHPVDEQVLGRMVAVANACPTHKLLTGQIRVDTTAGQPG